APEITGGRTGPKGSAGSRELVSVEGAKCRRGARRGRQDWYSSSGTARTGGAGRRAALPRAKARRAKSGTAAALAPTRALLPRKTPPAMPNRLSTLSLWAFAPA